MCTEEYWKKDEHFFVCEKVKILDTIMFELNPLSSQMTDRVYYAIALPYSFHVVHTHTLCVSTIRTVHMIYKQMTS